ncbi:MAG TPA: twin-arginine translocase subunit TatC [Bryobacteraceae bacterium]|nr:twin-arginine translocase subunit TatC [Bryobacteraceae bacterium]
MQSRDEERATGAPSTEGAPEAAQDASREGVQLADYGGYEDPYAYPATDIAEPLATELIKPEPPPPSPPAATEKEPEEDGDDEGMLRMSFLEHLEELRARIIKALAGLGVAFVLSLVFAERLWLAVQSPAAAALTSLGLPPKLAQLSPMEAFSVVWVKLPLLAAIFLASPWVLYQVWAFIAPGLYKRERRWAAPFVICSAGLFILGGVFAYFVAFRFGLRFLLGIGTGINILPVISISYYFDLFVNVMLGVGLVFELPVIIFFLTLLRIASPRWLMSNARYAILGIVVLAAIITPTPDVFNLMLFSVPMVLLFFAGVFASYLLVLSRENRRFPWGVFLAAIGIPILLIAGGVYLAIARFSYHLVPYWPFLVR